MKPLKTSGADLAPRPEAAAESRSRARHRLATTCLR